VQRDCTWSKRKKEEGKEEIFLPTFEYVFLLRENIFLDQFIFSKLNIVRCKKKKNWKNIFREINGALILYE